MYLNIFNYLGLLDRIEMYLNDDDYHLWGRLENVLKNYDFGRGGQTSEGISKCLHNTQFKAIKIYSKLHDLVDLTIYLKVSLLAKAAWKLI